MVKTDVGDDAYIRTDDIGAVQASAESHLDYGYIHLFIGKVAEGHGGGQLKERGMEGFEESTFLRYKTDDVFLGYRLSVNPDALPEIHQMGRGIEPDPVSCLLQYGGKRMRAGTLSIGTGHMNAAETAVGMFEVCVQGQSVFQSFLVC